MNNLEQLESHHRMYSWLEEKAKKCKYLDEDYKRNDWETLTNTYPELLTFVESLISHIKSLVNREQELLTETENLKKKIPPPSDREGLQSYQGWDEDEVDEEDEEIDDDDESCWVEYSTVEE